jgi:hypothetical protein
VVFRFKIGGSVLILGHILFREKSLHVQDLFRCWLAAGSEPKPLSRYIVDSIFMVLQSMLRKLGVR